MPGANRCPAFRSLLGHSVIGSEQTGCNVSFVWEGQCILYGYYCRGKFKSLLKEMSVGPDASLDLYAVEIVELDEEFGGVPIAETV